MKGRRNKQKEKEVERKKQQNNLARQGEYRQEEQQKLQLVEGKPAKTAGSKQRM